MPKRLRLKTFAETFRMICGVYPVYARSPSPSQRPAPTTIASRSPFPLGLCSCSTTLSKMGIYAAPRGRGALEEMRTYPRHAFCFASFLHYWSYRFSSIPEFYKLVYNLGFCFGFLQTGPNQFVENQKQIQNNTGRFGMKNLPKRLKLFFAETSLPKRPVPPQCCYLAKGAKRPSHTTNTIKFDRIPFDPCTSIKRFDLCPFDQKNSTYLQPPP